MVRVAVDYIAEALGVSVADVLRASSSREWTQRTVDGLASRTIPVDPDDVEAGEWSGYEFFIDVGDGTADDLVTEARQMMGLARPDDRPRRSRRRRREPLGDDLVPDAKALGIRARTLARLEARGHSAADVRRALPRALAAHPHVSRDEAIQAWYSSDK